MSTSSSALASSAREVAHPHEISHHHECVGLLIPEHITTNSLVTSTVLEEMPLQARTTHQPVILTHAPDRRITKQNETGTSGKTQGSVFQRQLKYFL
ncbi:hypothetical protein QQG55_38085 [Brugia pahangi]